MTISTEHAPSMQHGITRRHALRLAAAAPLAAGFPKQSRASVPGTLNFGVVPQQSATSLARDWVPMLQAVAQRSGVPIAFRTAPDIPAFEDRMLAGEYDLAYMNPYHYAVFSGRPGYRAFAREANRKLVGIIVVRKDSAVTELRQLAGTRVAFPAPAAFAASILTRAEFSRQGIPIEASFVASHDSVYRGVAQGIFAAGGGVRRTLEAIDPAVSANLRVLTSTPPYVPHAFAAHPRVAPDIVARVAAAMQSLDADDTGRALLGALKFAGLSPARDAEWDEIRALRIAQPVGSRR